MSKYCSNCGKELNNQNCCMECGNACNKGKSYRGYIKTSGIILIVIGSIIFLASLTSEVVNQFDKVFLTFTIPGLFAIAAGILSLVSLSNPVYLLIAGICVLIGAISNLVIQLLI